jgi:hypothetical protein
MKIPFINIVSLCLALSAMIITLIFLIKTEYKLTFNAAAALNLSLASVVIALFQRQNFSKQIFFPVLILSLLAFLLLGYTYTGKG